MENYTISLAQINLTVGDIQKNTYKIIEHIRCARNDHNADLVIFPELAITGYPSEDLLLRSKFLGLANNALDEIIRASEDIGVLISHPEMSNGKLYNSLSYIKNTKILAAYYKKDLPNYGVFDDKRYFSAGSETPIITLDSVPVALSICEDLWSQDHAKAAVELGAKLLISVNASPFHSEIIDERHTILQKRVQETGLSIIYVNLVGGQDEVVFDGGSLVIDGSGKTVFHAPQFEEGHYLINVSEINNELVFVSRSLPPTQLPTTAYIYQALVLGVRDYVQKNGFSDAVIGLSGGIDSALTLAIAVDAISGENVEAILMPSRYTADMSIDDSKLMAEGMGINYHIIPIEKPFSAFMEVLSPLFEGLPVDTAEENIQARCRGMLLMAISNKTGKLVLTTGNKSEMAVGYATLYGDMAGGFAPLKDVSKTMVYELSNWRNIEE